MSKLRNKIGSLRDDYRAAKYPGDLAADVLPPRRSLRLDRHPIRLLAVASAVTGAIAAAVLLWLANPGARPTHDPASPPIASAPSPQGEIPPQLALGADEEPFEPLATLSAPPAFPDDLAVALPAFPALPAEPMELGSMPSMPSMSFDFSETETSTEEAT